MNDMENIFQYKYRKEDLDAIIEKRNKGIESMIPEDMMEEVLLREKEIQIQIRQEISDEGIDDILTAEETERLIKKRKDLMDAQIEKERRNSHADDYITLEISDDEKAMMEELCAVSYVRKLPNSLYHKKDEELYDSAERREIMERLKKVGNMYYNVNDWRNAMTILLDAWKYSKDHDYPGIPEYLKEGHVKLNRQMPQLMLNYKTIITDPDMLRDILNGEIQCIDENEQVFEKKQRLHSSEVEGIELSKVGRVMGSKEYEYESQLARMGNNDSMVLAANRTLNTVYNRFSPDALLGKKTERLKNRLDENGYIRTFDFTKPGSGQKAFDIVSNKKKPTMADFANDIMKANDGKIVGNVLSGSVLNEFANGLSGTNSSDRYNRYTTIASNHQLQDNPQVHAQEQALLNAMRMYNPNR